MLAMMGWSEGKGLGIKEDGITESVKVTKREENRGLGSDINTSDNWLANTSAFDGILSRLNSRASVKENLAKMQESAPKKTTGVSNKRIRYHKLVKAKTLSNHKAEDISAILVPQKADDDYDVESVIPITDKKRKLEEIEEKEQEDKEDETTTKTKKRHTTKSKKTKTKPKSKSKISKAHSDSESSSDSDSNSDADSASSDSDSNSDSDASSSSSSDSDSSSSGSSSSSNSDSDSSSSDSDSD